MICPNRAAAFCPVTTLQTIAAISESPGMIMDESSNMIPISSRIASAVESRRIEQLTSPATISGAAWETIAEDWVRIWSQANVATSMISWNDGPADGLMLIETTVVVSINRIGPSDGRPVGMDGASVGTDVVGASVGADEVGASEGLDVVGVIVGKTVNVSV